MDDYYSESKRIDCFHCGGKLIVSVEGVINPRDNICYPFVFIKCERCGTSLFDDILTAIDRWNKRIDL